MSLSELPRGVLSVAPLPDPAGEAAWEEIVVPETLKDRLLGTALLSLLHGRRLAGVAGGPAGLVVLSGPPGTGKSTLGLGLAHLAAGAVAEEGPTVLVRLDSHSLPSEMLGESQRNISRLMRETIPEIAARAAHTVVLVDEVESLAVGRRVASFDTNPIDVQRATDALLEGMDHLALVAPGTLVVATTNFPSAIDEAFLSRADLVVELGLPDLPTRSEILRRALADLASVWPRLAGLAADRTLLEELASRTEGWDGRRVRKLPLAAVGSSRRLAMQPAALRAEDLRLAVGALW